jgi:hypothetical protein
VASLIKGRQFQLWEYHVSHGSLLFRICRGTATRGRNRTSWATAEETAQLEKILGKRICLPEQVYVLENSRGRFPLVAVSLSIPEHRGSVFKSPLC